MKKATLKRHVTRFEKAGKTIVRNIDRFGTKIEKCGTHVEKIGQQLIRPSDKLLDAMAKVLEGYGAVYGVLGDYADDVSNVLGFTARELKKSRDEAGYYTWEAFGKVQTKENEEQESVSMN